jgi:putative ABC transport system permease protein
VFAREILYSLRHLSRTPAFTLAAILSLALGIGANTAIFSLLEPLLFRSLPVRAPERLIRIGALENNGRTIALPGPMLENLRREPLLEGVCGFQTPLSTIEIKNTPEPLGALTVTGDCYKTLGVHAAIGRTFTPSDDLPNGARVAMLGYGFWQQRFGGNPNVLGQVIRIGGVPFTIIGVTEQRFHGLLVGFQPAVSYLLSQDYAVGSNAPSKSTFFWADVLARMRPDATQQQMQALLETKWRRLLEEYLPPDRFKGANREELLSMPPKITSGATGIDYSLRDRFRRPLTALIGVSFLVLLVSCINVANLLLARGQKLKREIAVRLALGASRGRIVRSQVLESALLLSGGVLSAAILAYSCNRLLIGILSRYYPGFSVEFAPDKYVLLFTAVTSLLALLLFGVLPAWQTSDIDSATTLKAASRGLSAARATNRRILVCGQVALTLVLVTGAAVFIETLNHLENESLGFQAEAVIDAQLMPLPNAFPNKFDVGTYCRELIDRMKSLPGVKTASMSSFSLLVTAPYKEDIRRKDTAERAILQAPGEFVSDGFLSTMRIPLLEGRDFSRTDYSLAQKTAIVSESLARRVFPHGSALGRHIQFGTEPETKDLQIIGVAADARLEEIHTDELSFVYFNFWQHPRSGNWGNLQVRYAGSTGEIASAIRTELKKAGRQYALSLRPVSEQRDYSLIREKLMATVGTVFAGLALTLAALGLFGLLSFLVASRTGEIGIRIALGAERGAVRWLILREALLLVGAGMAVGLPVCYGGVRELSSLFYGVSPVSTIPLLASIVILCAVAVTAALIPANRASAVDPIVALRQE